MYVLLFRILKTNELATMIFFSKEIGFNSKGTKKNISYAQRRRALMRFSHATEFWQNMNSQWSSQIDRGTKKKKSLECTLYLSIIWKKKNLFLLSTRFAQWKWKLIIISKFQTMKAAMKSYNSIHICVSIYLFNNVSGFFQG